MVVALWLYCVRVSLWMGSLKDGSWRAVEELMRVGALAEVQVGGDWRERWCHAMGAVEPPLACPEATCACRPRSGLTVCFSRWM